MAETITGEGTISAQGGGGASGHQNRYGGSGGKGRIRLEANKVFRTAGTNPEYSFGRPITVFVPNIPAINITSIAGVAVPENPSGTFGTPDVSLPYNVTNPVAVAISASNIPAGTTLTILAIPEFGSASSATATLSGTDSSSSATASVSISTQYQSVISVQATFTIQTAMYYDGERIIKARVDFSIGRTSDVTYITESGKEIPIEKLLAKVGEL